MKQTFAANTFASDTFASGTWRGVGVGVTMLVIADAGELIRVNKSNRGILVIKTNKGIAARKNIRGITA